MTYDDQRIDLNDQLRQRVVAAMIRIASQERVWFAYGIAPAPINEALVPAAYITISVAGAGIGDRLHGLIQFTTAEPDEESIAKAAGETLENLVNERTKQLAQLNGNAGQ